MTALLAKAAVRPFRVDPRALDILARTLWGEARGEGAAGMAAVAAVILNRAARPGWWGRDVAEICLKPRQFSCWLEGDPNRARLLAVDRRDPAFRQAVVLARAALEGGLKDPTQGATHYHARGTAPPWTLERIACAEIGGHLFYNDIA